MEGLVTRIHRGHYYVETDGDETVLVCRLRSKLRKRLVYPESDQRRQRVLKVRRGERGGPVAVGDRVRVTAADDQTGVIEEILPPDTELARRAAGTEDRYHERQRLVANVDQIMPVFAVQDPDPHFRFLDRYLVQIEAAELSAIICLNKADLGVPEDVLDMAEVYLAMGYPVLFTSAETGLGLDDLRAALKGHATAFLGPSGVGKSSLLNAVQPDLALHTGEVSEITGKGRHTTTGVARYELDGGGTVIDTPGLRELGLWDVEPESVDVYFRDLAPFIDHCRFPDCVHLTEPGCAVLDALERGDVTPERYESYLRLRGL
ncbi:MAG: ribosome small subunit-dependent GTPase A [Chloroflexi bacterium]|nr:ribosome small subunit-dependent GTPase A [Chloroflexota bacterium]MBU1746433.1 ribosome small subunit-dependent GTPase A [Chloroflexota bacterium]